MDTLREEEKGTNNNCAKIDLVDVCCELKILPLSTQDAENCEYASMHHERIHSKVLKHCQSIQDAFAGQTFLRNPKDSGKYIFVWYFAFANQNNPWTCELCSKAVKSLSLIFLDANKCESISAFIGKHHQVIGEVLNLLSNDLTRDTWRCHPASYTSLIELIQLCPHGSLFSYLPTIFPLLLWFVDDFHPNIVLLGINGISALLDVVPKAEMRQQGRAEVIYDALKKKVFSNEPDVIQRALSCLQKSIAVLERDPCKYDSSHPVTRYDTMFQILLSNLGTCTNTQMTRVYLKSMNEFIGIMQLSVVRHLKLLLPRIQHHLELADCYDEVVSMVIMLMKVAWPRFQHHTYEVVKFMFKRLMRNIPLDENSLKKTVECLSAIMRNDKKLQETIKELLQQPFLDKYPQLLHVLEPLG